MSLVLHLLKQSEGLETFAPIIEQTFEEAKEKITHILPVKNVDVVIVDNAYNAIPEIGIGGHTYTPHVIVISIDSHFPQLHKNLYMELLDTLAHELHHAARWQAVGYGETLLEAMISEGLADHFGRQITGIEVLQPWDKALTKEQIQTFLQKAKDEYDSKNYSHYEWFFGSEERNIPRWTGYALGFHIVAEYLKNHSDQTAASLYNAKAKSFL